MKRKLLNTRFLKQTALAVPAAALMLGAAHGGTVGFNLDSYYYDNTGAKWVAGATRMPDGGGLGYQTSGWVVTAKAFGVDPADWFYAEVFAWWTATPIDVTTNKGSITAHITAPASIETGIGEQVVDPGWTRAQTVAPGNDQVTWNILQSAGGVSPSIQLSGLAANYPNGYVAQTITAQRGAAAQFDGVGFTDGTTTTHADYTTTYYRKNLGTDGAVTDGTIGLSGPSGTFTNDTFEIDCDPETTGSKSVLSGFIITDKPVITYSYPPNTLAAVGGSFVLSASVIGIDTLSYQWQHAGTNLPGATLVNYTNAFATLGDNGNYQLIVTGSRFPSSPATGDVLVVTVVPPHLARTATWDANTAMTGAQDGSGKWSYTLTNWWTGSVDDYWGSPDSAVFGVGGAGPYTVTLGENITANTITFNNGGYTITNSSGQTLTVGSTPSITANASATIGAPLTTGTNAFVKAGNGALKLSGALTCSNVFVGAGTLEVLAKSGDSPYVVTNGATLKLGYSTGGGYASTAMQLYGDGAAATTGLYLLGGKNYNTSGGLVVNNAPTTIRQYGTGLAGIGMFDINGTPGLSITPAASGSVTDPNVQMISSGYGMVLTTAAGANTATGDLIINGPLNVGALGFLKEGSGSVRLNAVASPGNVALNVMGGSVICGTVNCVGVNAILNAGAVNVSGVHPTAGTVFDLNGFSQTVTNATLGGTLKMTINKGGTPSSTVLTTTDIAAPLTYGGDLIATNIGGALAIGDTFTLFNNLSGSGYAGAFNSLTLPPLGDGQGWQDNTAVDGTIKVTVGSVPPTITTDLPTDPSYAYVGGSVTFFIVASGDPLLHYQWKRGTTTVGTDSPTLSLTSVSTSDTGDYSVTVSNHYGSAPSGTNHLTVLSPSGYPAIAMAGGPAAYWPLDELSGSTAVDYAGGHNASYLGAVTLDVPGAIPGSTGTAITASTGGNYASAPYAAALNPAGPFTVVAWFNPSGPADAGFFVCPLASADLSSNRKGWLIYQSPTGWNFRTYLNNGATAGVNITGTTAPVIGAWTQVVGVWDGTKGYLYENGALTATSAATTFVPNSTAPFTIGARSDGAYYLNGTSTDDISIDEVQFYNRALSSQEIQALALNRPILKITPSGGSIVLTWPTGTLQAAPEATGTYTNMPTATSPWPVTPTQARTFYRILVP